MPGPPLSPSPVAKLTSGYVVDHLFESTTTDCRCKFNLETPDSDLLKESLRVYRTISSSSPPPFELQVLLSVPELSSNQVLVHLAPDSSRLRIDPIPQHIVLETWALNFIPSVPNTEHPGDVAPSTIYKHGIPLFRSLYSLLRILPSWKLYKRLRRRISSPYRTGNMSIQLRIKGVDVGMGHILSFGKYLLTRCWLLWLVRYTILSLEALMSVVVCCMRASSAIELPSSPFGTGSN